MVCSLFRKQGSYSPKTKRDGWTNGRTDGRTGGHCNISRPGRSARWEIKMHFFSSGEKNPSHMETIRN